MTTNLFRLVLFFSFLFFSFQNQSAQNNFLHFDGSDDYVTAPLPTVFDAIGSTPHTIEAYVYVTNGNFKSVVYAQSSQSYLHVNMAINLGKVAYYVKTGNGPQFIKTYITNELVPLNQWVHIAVTWGGSNNAQRVYINGVPATQFLGSSSSSTDINNTLTIGGIGSSASGRYNGLIDEVRIWDVARTEAEILENMNVALTGSEANLVAYYNFNHGTCAEDNAGETTLTDLTGNYDGTLNNFALDNCTSNWVCAGASCGYPDLPDASPAIPTLSQWGLIILALLLMTAGTLYLVQPNVEEKLGR
ncbi:MAG: IPTL-CTERM sorting domain-containing protein [Chitinophagales bacterium]